MNGGEVFKFATKVIVESIKKILEKAEENYEEETDY